MPATTAAPPRPSNGPPRAAHARAVRVPTAATAATARTQAVPPGSAAAALPRRSTADEKKPASDCTRGGQTVMWVGRNPTDGTKDAGLCANLPARIRSRLAVCRFITPWQHTARFSRSSLWCRCGCRCNTSGPDNADTAHNRGARCHGKFNSQCVGIEFGMPCCVQKRGARVFKACRNDGG